ncbi:MAG: uroporphyrinogen-III C-methyltransferase [Algisphaera sp.]
MVVVFSVAVTGRFFPGAWFWRDHRPDIRYGSPVVTASTPHAADKATDVPIGTVHLVGAGPGDPGLITVTGRALLERAGAVVFDALANPALLALAPASARRIDVGKRAQAHKLTQDETNQLLVDLACEGLEVVRLKGGDPYLFGRGAEECAFLAARGVRCEVVPGVTAGLAAPAMAGIPVTHRKVASTVTIVTGHEDPTKAHTSVDYAGLAGLLKAGGTACFYMGVGRLPQISSTLIAQGLGPDTPAAVVQWGTLPQQRHVVGTLNTIVDRVKQAQLGAPAIVVVGAVAALDEPGLDFFTNRPLFGQRVLVTRTRQQASDLTARLSAAGAQVFEAPTLELVAPENWDAVDAAVGRLGLSQDAGGYGWLVLTSVNAVDTLADRLRFLGRDARALAGVKIAVVGGATQEALEHRLRVIADVVPTQFTAESMAADLLASQDLRGQRCLLLRADIARPALPERLVEAGAVVDEVVAYETRLPDALDAGALAALRAGEIDWVTFTSSSTARNLHTLLGEDAALLASLRIASMGPVTSDTVRGLGLPLTVQAPTATLEALVESMVETAAEPSFSCADDLSVPVLE